MKTPRALFLLFLALLGAALAFTPPPSSSSSSCACVSSSRQSTPGFPLAASASSSSSSSDEPTSTCRACLKQYKASENGPTACRHHPGIYSGRLARIDDTDASAAKDWFYSCCGEEDKGHPGCTQDYHRSFDDPPSPWRSGFQ